MKIALYTCMFGNYDRLPTHKLVPELDYIPIDKSMLNFGPVDASRYYKMLPHTFLAKFDISVYADSNMDLVDPSALVSLCNELINSTCSAILFKHPKRNTIHEEILACIRQGVGLPSLLKDYNRYRREGFKDDVGLTENNVLIRKHHARDIVTCERFWWEEFFNGCKRDQVCFPYARWKTNYTNFILMEQRVKEDIFKWRYHGC